MVARLGIALLMTSMLLISSLCPCASGAAGGVEWTTDYNLALERARIERKPVMVFFYTTWCYYCKVLDARTFTDKDVIGTAERFVCVRINGEKERALARRYRVMAYPFIALLSRDGTGVSKVYGYQPPAAMKNQLGNVLDNTARLDKLKEAHTKNSRDGEAAYLLADELMALGRFGEAKPILEKVLKTGEGRRKEDAALDVALCEFREGYHKSASARLEKFLARFEESPRLDEARLFYGMALISAGSTAKGVETLDKLQEKAPGTWVGQEASRYAGLHRQKAD
ncbi:MAG: thioredoxin family protein [Candidatus Eisenbacteria bacterium]